MQKIIPHLWYEKEAKEAANFYVSVFKKSSKIINITQIHDTPSGDCDIVSFKLFDQDFMAISAGPYFKFTPAISFIVACDTKKEVDDYWSKLSKGGMALMELGSYPFSDHYGWTQDKFGLSWQIMLTSHHKMKQRITPVLMFIGKNCGKAQEAIKYYSSIFKNAKLHSVTRYSKNEAPDKESTAKYAAFMLESQEFAAMDSAYDHKFSFNEAVSFIVKCDTQSEIDYYWKLSAVKESEQCGWLKDKYGVSWQIVPKAMDDLMTSKDKKKVAKVTEAFLKMKKFDIKKLEEAAK